MAGVMIDIPGVGTVEAKNAASESTLKELLKAIQDGAGGGYKKGGKPGPEEKNKGGGPGGGGGKEGGGGGGKAAPSMFGLGKAVGAAIRPIQQATGGFMALGKESAQLIQSFANVGDSFSGAASVFSGIPVLGTIFGAVAAAADKTLGSYQAATASGATFGGSMNAFAGAASAAGMTMDKFGQLIAQNGEALMTLGGTTENGAKQFANMSKEIRGSAIGAQLYGLGMTTEQVNQGMASYLKTYGASGALQGKSTRELAQGAGQYLKELDALAKITGQNRAEIQKEQEARMKDSQFRAAIANLDADQAKMMNNFVSSFPKEQQEAVKDMIATGNITSDAAIMFNQQMGGTAQEVMNMGNIIRSGGKLTQQSYDNAYKGAIREAKVAASSEEARTQALYNSQQFGNTYIGLAELAKRDINGKEKALTEQEKAAAAQAAAMEKAKQNLAAFSNSFQMALANSGILDLMLKAFQVAADLVMNWVVPAFQIFSAVITEVGTFLIDTLKPVFATVSDFIRDTLYPIFLDLAAIVMVDVWPALQAVGDIIQTYVWPALQTIGGVIMDYVYPVFETMYTFIADNLQPILLALGTALVAYAGYVAIMNGIELIRNGLLIASSLGLGGLTAAAWAAAAPILAIVAPIVALVGLFTYLYKSGWTFGTAIDAVKDNFSRLWLTLQDWMDGLLVMIPNALGGISEEEAKKRQEIRDQTRKELDEKEKARDKEREAKAAERSSENKAQQRKEAAAKIDQKIVDLKNKGAGGLSAANDREQKARDKAAELKEIDLEDPNNMLLGYAQQQKSAFIKNPEGSTTTDNGKKTANAVIRNPERNAVAGAEGGRRAIESEADKQKRLETEEKARVEAAKKEAEEKAKGKGPAPTTQESSETLLASLNTKMDQLIKINKGVHEVNERQLGVQQSLSGDVYASV